MSQTVWPGFDVQRLEQRLAVLFALPRLARQPGRTLVVHRLGDFPAFVEGVRRRNLVRTLAECRIQDGIGKDRDRETTGKTA